MLLFNESKAPSVSTCNQIQTLLGFFFLSGKICECQVSPAHKRLIQPITASDLFVKNTLTRSLYIDTTLLRQGSRWNERADVLWLPCHQLMIRLTLKRMFENTRTLLQELSVSSLTWRRSVCSYLFPDGRTQNPDLTGLCEPSPQDHIKVTQVRSVRLHQPVSWHLFFFFFLK